MSLELKIDELVYWAEKNEHGEEHDAQHASFSKLYEPALICQRLPCLVDEPRQEHPNCENTYQKLEIFSKG